MIKILRDQWAKNEHVLKEALEKLDHEPTYADLVELTFDKIYNHENDYCYKVCDLKTDSMTHINDGDYEGTHIFLIPFDTYDPDASDYLMTYASYGSCSGCDTLLSITGYMDPPYNEGQIKNLLSLCRDIVVRTIRPYNFGWRSNELFEQVEFEVEEENAED